MIAKLNFIFLIICYLIFAKNEMIYLGELNGTIRTFDEKYGLMSIVSYKNGKRNGWCVYYGYGTYGKYIKEKSFYIDDVKNGWSYHSNGLPDVPDNSNCYYVYGIKHGWCYLVKRRGTEKVLYRNGKRFGKYYSRHYGGGHTFDDEVGYISENGIILNSDNIELKYVEKLEKPDAYKKQKWSKPLFGYIGDDDYYHFDNLIDGIKETVWISPINIDNANDHFRLEKKNKKLVKYLVIVNGNRESNKEYLNYSRLKKAMLYIEYLKDTPPREGRSVSEIKKMIYFSDNFEIKKIPIFTNKWISVSMLSYENYPGKKYKNLAVSDFYFEY